MTLHPNFAIGIPTLNRADLLIPALLYYQNDFPNVDIYVIDNGNQEALNVLKLKNVTIISQPHNIGVASSWNILCNKIFKIKDFALILNDDIYLGKNEHEILLLIENMQVALYTSPVEWCTFLLPKTTYTTSGEFDEGFFPAYFEDNDYEYRISINGLQMAKIPFLMPSVFRRSQTIQLDPTIKEGFSKTRERYIAKWGGEPTFETYKKSFNKN